MSLMLHRAGLMTVGVPADALVFSTGDYNAEWTAPVIVASTLVDADVVWRRPDGTTFTGKTPAMTEFSQIGTYWLMPSDWAAVTQLVFGASAYKDFLHTFQAGKHLSKMTTLSYFDLQRTTNLTQSIEGWVFPNSVTNLQFRQSALKGDISELQLPTQLEQLHLGDNDFEGDVTQWSLPEGLILIYLSDNSKLEGDISQWDGSRLPTSLLRLEGTKCTYGTGQAFRAITDAIWRIWFNGCNLDEADVDRVLVDLDESGIDNSVRAKVVQVHGNNDAPTATGIAAGLNLRDNKGWTVTVTGGLD